jgi:NAD(P)H dehydrogenase (quinone)
MSRVSGKPVTYQPISLDKFTDRLHRRGYHDHLIQHLQAVAIDYRNGIFTASHDIVTTVDGAEPQTVKQFVMHNKRSFDKYPR